MNHIVRVTSLMLIICRNARNVPPFVYVSSTYCRKIIGLQTGMGVLEDYSQPRRPLALALASTLWLLVI